MKNEIVKIKTIRLNGSIFGGGPLDHFDVEKALKMHIFPMQKEGLQVELHIVPNRSEPYAILLGRKPE